MNTENCVILPDGRTLTYAEFGQPDGNPVLYFHGLLSSRLEPLLIGDDELRQLGLHIIAPDRPGMGGSDFQSGRGFSDWPDDVTALADGLGLGTFSVLGNSGGGGYAAVCAAKIPERLRAVVIVSGAWRMDWPEAKVNSPFLHRLAFILAGNAPFLLRLLLKLRIGIPQGERAKQLAQFRKRFPPADYAVLEQPGRLETFGRAVHESMRQGTKGPVWDMRLYAREFDFALDEIRMPLTVFHGERDTSVSIALTRRAVAGLASGKLVAYPEEAHLSALCNHFGEFAQVLAEPISRIHEGA
jgi:pimeloyl-ACP methyl ester carboxylesterase